MFSVEVSLADRAGTQAECFVHLPFSIFGGLENGAPGVSRGPSLGGWGLQGMGKAARYWSLDRGLHAILGAAVGYDERTNKRKSLILLDNRDILAGDRQIG